MAQNFISVDREQVFLLSPSVADWVPEDHLVWSVLEAVEQLDLSGFLRRLPGRWAWPSGIRAVDDGLAAALRLRAREQVFAAD